MKLLFYNIRFYILTGSILLSGIIYMWISQAIPAGSAQVVKLQETYALLSLVYLYVALLIGPLWYTFPFIPCRSTFNKARRAIGVSAFYFGLLHSSLTFFGQLEGFSGLAFLDNKYLVAISLGFISLVILLFLTITSFDYAVKKMKFKNWKILHRFTYLAGVLILIHAFLLGIHFSDLSGIISQVTFLALAFLLLLESPRIDIWINKRFPLPQFRFMTTIFITLLGIIYFTIFSPFTTKSDNTISFDIHAAHRQLAQQAVQQNQFSPTIDLSKIPGLQGDRNKRYTVTFNNPPGVQPNQDTILRFRTYDASNGNPVSFYRILYAKTMHIMVVDNTLTYFNHIHPIQEGNDFVITTQFPAIGLYHIYLEFQPFGGIEQQFGFTLPVGIDTNSTIDIASQSADTNLTKTFGDYAVTLNTHGTLEAQAMSLGNDTLSFTIKNTRTKQPVTNLKPYLASFGHLTMINEKSYDFIHVHPYSIVVPPLDANGGPTVDFLPIGIYGPFKPGIYRAFAEFNPDGHLFTADFTMKVN